MVVIDEGATLQNSVTVGVTTVELSSEKNNLKRTEIIITNTSTVNQVITLGIGQDAVAGVGIVLYPGASYVASIDSKYKPTNGRITAISSAASGSIAIFERSI